MPARILYVENEPGLRRAVGRLLTSCGFDVVKIASVADACVALGAEGVVVDVVLTDGLLDDGTAVDLLRWIDAHRPDLAERVVVVSGGVPDDVRAEVTRRGLWLLDKPLHVDLFGRIVGGLLARGDAAALRAKLDHALATIDVLSERAERAEATIRRMLAVARAARESTPQSVRVIASAMVAVIEQAAGDAP